MSYYVPATDFKYCSPGAQGWFDLNQRLDFFPFKADLNHRKKS